MSSQTRITVIGDAAKKAPESALIMPASLPTVNNPLGIASGKCLQAGIVFCPPNFFAFL
jgi:hypothetical protein